MRKAPVADVADDDSVGVGRVELGGRDIHALKWRQVGRGKANFRRRGRDLGVGRNVNRHEEREGEGSLIHNEKPID